jgi:UV DNA damage endonuclease
MSVKLGYACINNRLRQKGIFASKGITLATFRKKGLEEVKRIALSNLMDLYTILQFNEKKGIRFFRITSNLFPHLGSPYLSMSILGRNHYNIDFARSLLKKIGKYARENDHRLTMHPGQYTQLGSPNPGVVEKAMVDLINHADILRAMGMTPEMGSVIVIHGGGHFNDRTTTLKRFCRNFLKLPKYVQKYITLENDEIYSVMDLLPICNKLKIPLTPDFFHDTLNSVSYLTGEEYDIYSLMKHIIKTWKIRGIKPKCHYSHQMQGARRGAHSLTINSIDPIVLDTIKKYNMDMMLEVKDKEVSVFKLYNKYFKLSIDKGSMKIVWDL